VLTIRDNLGGHSRNFLKIVLCTSRDSSKEDLFTHSTSKSHAHSVDELLSSVEVSFTVKRSSLVSFSVLFISERLVRTWGGIARNREHRLLGVRWRPIDEKEKRV